MSTLTMIAAPAWEEPAGPVERLAAWALRGPLTAALTALGLAQLATWIPHYLTWPWWADHDAYATIAHGWHLGMKPYRDILCNNFPGQIYLFWLLGHVAGWGRTASIYALDAGFVVVFGAMLLAWSRRRFGRLLPGVVGLLTFLGYYLNLDYSQAAQRDWHAPFFAVTGILALQAWPGRWGRLASALALAAAMTFRPQAVLFLPALAVALDGAARPSGAPVSRTLRAGLAWALAFAAALALAFAPLVAAGVWGDFVQGVRQAGYGSPYNRVGLGSILKQVLIELSLVKVWVVLGAVAVLWGSAAPSCRAAARAWVVALAGVLLYRPLSPIPHAYLIHPVMVVWSVLVAVLVAQVLGATRLTPALQLAVVGLVLGLQATGRPAQCNPERVPGAIADLGRGEDPELAPLGYRPNLAVKDAAPYAWEDYRAALAYLRRTTSPRTRVANALKRMPAITGPIARLPAFPAESVEWLLVRPDDEEAFARALERTPDSVVVWGPEEPLRDCYLRLDRLTPVILRLYEPEARFGVIEVWRRKTPDRGAS